MIPWFLWHKWLLPSQGHPHSWIVPTLLAWLRSAMSIYTTSTCFTPQAPIYAPAGTRWPLVMHSLIATTAFTQNGHLTAAVPIAIVMRFLPVHIKLSKGVGGWAIFKWTYLWELMLWFFQAKYDCSSPRHSPGSPSTFFVSMTPFCKDCIFLLWDAACLAIYTAYFDALKNC